jgi:Protein of unknown function (DUF4054)
MDPNKFRLDFPEFDNATVYPNTFLLFWSTVAAQLIDANRWASLYTQGVELFVAHNVALQQAGIATAANGGIPGGANGVLSAKTVGNVSINYDNADVMLPNAGHWNQTTYGRQYLQLARLLGSGCVQL